MKFKKLLITGVTVLSLGTISGFTVATHADPTPAERNASLAVDNALTQKYGNHVPTSASIKAENNLDREFEGGSNGSGNSQATQSSNNQQSHNSQPSTSNKNVNSASNNNSNKSNNSGNNKATTSKHKNKNNKALNKKHNHKNNNQKTKSTTNTKSSKNHRHNSNHHFLEIGIVVVVVILAIIGFCAKLFGHKNKH